MATMVGIAKCGNPNVIHLVKLVDAEDAAIGTKSRKRAVKLYEEAITLAGRGGFVQDVALANERLADYLLWSSNGNSGEADNEDKEEAKFRLGKAIEYYTEWGAHRKVQLLQSKLALFKG